MKSSTYKTKIIVILMVFFAACVLFEGNILTLINPKIYNEWEEVLEKGSSILVFVIALVVYRNSVMMIKKINKQEEHFRRLVEFCPEPIFLHNGQEILYGNPSFVKAIGAEHLSSIINKTLKDLIHHECHHMIHERKVEVHQNGEVFPIEYKIVRFDGQVRDWELSTIVITVDGKVLYQVIGKDITERKQMEASLLESREQLKNIFDSLDMAVWSSDSSGGTTYSSAGVEKVYGYPQDAFAENPMLWFSRVIPEDRVLLEERKHDLHQGKPKILEYRIYDSEGKIKWVQDRAVPKLNEVGNVLRLDGVVIDVTHKKSIEQALKESEAKYRLMTENMNDFISIIDTNGKIVYESPSHKKLFKEVCMGDGSAFNYIHQDDITLVQEAINDVLETKLPKKVVFRSFINKKGDVIYIEAEGTPIINENGQVEQIVVVGRDITTRKMTEDELKLTKEKLERILDSVDIALWSLDLNDGNMYVSQGIVKITGYDPHQFYHHKNMWNQIIFQDDLSLVEQIRKDTREGVISNREFRIVDRQGQVRWVYHCGYPTFNDKGLIIQINGVTLDITEKKEAEIALKDSKELHQLLQESLDHFSREVFNVMKVSELENRLLNEIQQVIPASSPAILEFGEVLKLKRGNKDAPLYLVPSIQSNNNIGQLISIGDGTFVKIGERNDSTFWLWIDQNIELTTHFPIKVWLETITRYVSIWYENLHRIEDLTIELEQMANKKQTPSWLLRLLFQVSERERMSLSIDLHDSALQEQIIWYRRMELLLTKPSLPLEIKKEIERIHHGMNDVIKQIRLTCNELRPPFLKKFGLVNSLKSMFAEVQSRSDYEIYFHVSGVNVSLNADQELAIYRIVQELLNNASKHSKATRVDIGLIYEQQKVELHYEDNGIGLADIDRLSYNKMGLFGIKERVKSLEGTIKICSSEREGFQAQISIPTYINEDITLLKQ